MATDTIQAHYDTLADIASKLDARHTSIGDMQGRLKQQYDNLRAEFQGEAADKFFEEMESVIFPRVARLENAFGESAKTTRQVVQKMQDAEGEASNLFKGGKGLSLTDAATAFALGSIIGGPLIGIGLVTFLNNRAQGGSLTLGEGYSAGDAIKGVFGILDDKAVKVPALLKGFDAIAAHGATDLKSFYTKLEAMNPLIKGGSKALEFGIVGGALDFAVGQDHSLKEFGVQMSSSVAQALVGKIPYAGPVITLGNAGVQLGGNLTAEVIKHNAMTLVGGDVVKGQQLVATANRFESALKGIDLDNRIDGVFRAIYSGENVGTALETEAKTFMDNLSPVANEGAKMISQATTYPIAQAEQYVHDVVHEISVSSGVHQFSQSMEQFVRSISP